MTAWATFAGFAGVVLVLLLLLAHASRGTASDLGAAAPADGTAFEFDAADRRDVGETRHPARDARGASLSTAALLANVALSQGLFGLLLVFGAWYTEVPLEALGVAGPLAPAVLVGTAFGGVLYVANELGAAAGARVGLGDASELRAALAPESLAGWAVLLCVVLPVIAGFEELLFRGALVGVVSAGFGVSPWLMAAFSSVAFALGHGAQGSVGIFVTGLLGFALAAAFVLTGSLAVVVVAHYLVNALEFVVHEGLGVEWS